MRQQGSQMQGNSAQNQGPGTGRRNSSTFIYILVAVFVVAALVVIYEAYLMYGNPSGSAVLQNRSLNGTPIYLSTSQAGLLLGSQVSSYDTADLFSPASQVVNMSDLVSGVPTLLGNVTSAWVTIASGSNATANATMQFYVFQTSNSMKISGALYETVTSEFNSSMHSSYGAKGGVSYSYGIFKNSTMGLQVLSAWKGGTVVLAVVQSYPSFTMNETSLIGIAANETR